jgi:hypothetical protein
MKEYYQKIVDARDVRKDTIKVEVHIIPIL